MTTGTGNLPAGWQERLCQGDRRVLGICLSEVENDGPGAAQVLRLAAGRGGNAFVVGITGPPGAGKSTLAGALVPLLRQRNLRVGIIAVDPSSATSGGALLGDRLRIRRSRDDDGVFVRSVASRGAAGGLSRTTARIATVMDGAGLDILLVETVGTGQNEVMIASLASLCLVLVPPDGGDAIQAMKAGILEIADIILVSRGDTPGARQTLALFRARSSCAMRIDSLSGTGIARLADMIVTRAGQADRPRRVVQGTGAGMAVTGRSHEILDLVLKDCHEEAAALAEREGDDAAALYVLEKACAFVRGRRAACREDGERSGQQQQPG